MGWPRGDGWRAWILGEKQGDKKGPHGIHDTISVMQSQTETDAQSFIATFTPTDAEGNPGQYIGTPAWSSDTPTVATVTQSASNPGSGSVSNSGVKTPEAEVCLQPLSK